MRRIEMAGKQIGLLTVIKFAGHSKGNRARVQWECVCTCGQTTTVRAEDLRSGNTTSCGCQQFVAAIAACTTHGACTGGKTKEYKAYIQAKVRCTNEKASGDKWPFYGGRGIEFRFLSFEEFIAHIGLAPSPDHSLDRIENNGHYEVGNVRWATKSTQMLNRRKPCRTRA